MHRLIACEYCDLLQREAALPAGCAARCGRCGSELYRNRRFSLDRTLAFTLTAGVLLVIANLFPIVSLDLQGHRSATSLFGAAQALWQHDMRALACLVFLTTVALPLTELATMIAILLPLRLGWRMPGLARLLRFVQAIRPWGMIEVFVLALLVTLVKLAHVASVHADVAFWAFAAQMVALAAAALSFDTHGIWSHMDEPA